VNDVAGALHASEGEAVPHRACGAVLHENLLICKLEPVPPAAFPQVLRPCQMHVFDCDVRCIAHGHNVAQDVDVLGVLWRPECCNVFEPHVPCTVNIEDPARMHVVRGGTGNLIVVHSEARAPMLYVTDAEVLNAAILDDGTRR